MELARNITETATRLNNDVNGNPRYYVPVYMFSDSEGLFYRPKYCKKYRGKAYGAGWIFQSYSLEYDISQALKEGKGV
jgi:hypothetical protein